MARKLLLLAFVGCCLSLVNACTTDADCGTDGTCTDDQCVCTGNTIGDTCQYACPACVADQGTCELPDGTEAPVCTCNDGFIGDLCAKECPADCSDQEMCALDADGMAVCACNEGLTRVDDMCVDCSDCKDNEQCTLTAENVAQCVCNDGLARVDDMCVETCDDDENKCMNEGTCGEDPAVCTCKEGYTGSFCENSAPSFVVAPILLVVSLTARLLMQ